MNAQIRWYHDGTPHRVVVLPELPSSYSATILSSAAAERAGALPMPAVRFEAETAGRWTDFDPNPASPAFASAAAESDTRQWQELLGLFPARVRRFLLFFLYERLEALAVITRCPALLAELEEVPALTAFLAGHAPLRGADGPRWDEINAVYENGGIYALLEWLGMPACRQTLTVLSRLDDPELARSLLAPLRSALWEPETLLQLGHADSISEKELALFRHPLAA